MAFNIQPSQASPWVHESPETLTSMEVTADWKTAPLVGGQLIRRNTPTDRDWSIFRSLSEPWMFSGEVKESAHINRIGIVCIQFEAENCSLFQFVGFDVTDERYLLNQKAFTFMDKTLVKKLKKEMAFDYFYSTPFQATQSLYAICIFMPALFPVAVLADLILMPVAVVGLPPHLLNKAYRRSANTVFFKDGKKRKVSGNTFIDILFNIVKSI